MQTEYKAHLIIQLRNDLTKNNMYWNQNSSIFWLRSGRLTKSLEQLII